MSQQNKSKSYGSLSLKIAGIFLVVLSGMWAYQSFAEDTLEQADIVTVENHSNGEIELEPLPTAEPVVTVDTALDNDTVKILIVTEDGKQIGYGVFGPSDQIDVDKLVKADKEGMLSSMWASVKSSVSGFKSSYDATLQEMETSTEGKDQPTQEN